MNSYPRAQFPPQPHGGGGQFMPFHTGYVSNGTFIRPSMPQSYFGRPVNGIVNRCDFQQPSKQVPDAVQRYLDINCNENTGNHELVGNTPVGGTRCQAIADLSHSCLICPPLLQTIKKIQSDMTVADKMIRMENNTVLPRNNLSKTVSGLQTICMHFVSAGAHGCVQLASFPRLLCVRLASVLRLRAPAGAGACVLCVAFCVRSSGKRIRRCKLHDHLL